MTDPRSHDDEIIDAEVVPEDDPEETSTELEQFTGAELVDPSRSRLRRRMAVVNDRAFENQPEVKELYENVLAQMLMEAEVIPGFGTLQDTAIELYAYCWASHKGYAAMNDPLPAMAYEKLVGRMLQALKTITGARNEASAEEQFKRQFAQQVMKAVQKALADTVPDDVAVRIQQAVIHELRDLVT